MHADIRANKSLFENVNRKLYHGQIPKQQRLKEYSLKYNAKVQNG